VRDGELTFKEKFLSTWPKIVALPDLNVAKNLPAAADPSPAKKMVHLLPP
jgi:hypothetical protein